MGAVALVVAPRPGRAEEVPDFARGAEVECSYGPRYRYDGVRTRLPYGHAMRLEQNRKPETAFFWRDSRNEEIKSSVCSYNHISAEQIAHTETSLNYVLDRKTGMRFKRFFCDAPARGRDRPATHLR